MSLRRSRLSGFRFERKLCVQRSNSSGTQIVTQGSSPWARTTPAENAARIFAGTSFDAELDSAGRVTLNQALIDHAGIDREVMIVGNLDHLEVWDRGRWASERDSLGQEISGIAESLGHPS